MRRVSFYLMISAVAFSCMTYELVLAQVSSALLGNALLRYTVTIGLYLGSLGAGALVASRLKAGQYALRLFWTEIILIFFGGLSPVIVVLVEWSLRKFLDPTGLAFGLALQAAMYATTVGVGFLSGLELPILIHLGEERLKIGGGRVMAVDQLGTVAALLIFSWYLIPQHGLFMAAAVACAVSCVAAIFTVFLLPREDRDYRKLCALTLGTALSASLLIGHSQLTNAVSRSIYVLGAK